MKTQLITSLITLGVAASLQLSAAVSNTQYFNDRNFLGNKTINFRRMPIPNPQSPDPPVAERRAPIADPASPNPPLA